MFEHAFAPIRIRDMELKKQNYPAGNGDKNGR